MNVRSYIKAAAGIPPQAGSRPPGRESRMKTQSDSGRCQTTFVDRERVERVRRATKGPAVIRNLAQTFHVLSDPTRVRILFALATEELCVCDLSSLIGASASLISHHLRLLRRQRLVRFRREGRMAYYSLDDDHVRSIFREGLRHVAEKAGPGARAAAKTKAAPRAAARVRCP
jgi:DNA-binding transcriptional ArsR family regulator